MLFHTRRQVAYALLTRPPLTVFLQFVRLECVRHAASVHPEPGSNSLVFIINRLSPDLCFLPERFSCSITFSSFQSFFSGFLALSPSYFYQVFRCLKFCCSIFKDRAPGPLGNTLPFGASLIILLFHASFVKPFFKFFWGFFKIERIFEKRPFFWRFPMV